jgi:TRAP-type C4-dicarboxylate transport system substrate-binding protein
MKKVSLIMAILVGVTLVFAPFLVACEAEHPEEVIELTYGGLYPPDHPFSLATQAWIDKIYEETDGWVQITPFWGAALYGSRDSATELGKGVADTGDFSGAYAAAGFDFEKSFRMVFYGVDDRALARKVYDEVNAKYPELKAEFTDANIKVMAYASVPPYHLITVDKAVRTVGDFSGLVLKTTGDIGKLAAALGAEGETIGMGETYVALQKHTIDGGFVTDETLASFMFAEVVKYCTRLYIASAPAGHWGMCLDVWNSLPDYIQEVFEDNILWLGLKVEELAFAKNEEGIAMANQHGVEFITLSAADLATVYAAADTVIGEEMAALDAKGLPGTAVYTDIRRLIEEYGD